MTLIQVDEATAARRRVPFQVFTSNGTTPDTGVSDSGDSVVLAINSATTIIPDVLVQSIETAQGMYYVELSASNVSVVGNHLLYYTQGDFTQHVANVNIVSYDPYAANLGLENISASQVSSTVSTVLLNHRIPELMIAALASQPTTGSLFGDLTEDDVGTQRFTSNALENAPTGSGATAGQTARQVWTEAVANHRTLGSFGAVLGMVSSAGSLFVSGSTSSGALGSGETSVDDIHNGAFIVVQYPDGSVLGNIIDDYTGSGQVASFKNNFPVAVGSSVTYLLFPGTAETDLSTQTIGSVLTCEFLDSSVTLNANTHSGATIDGALVIGNSGISEGAFVAGAITSSVIATSASDAIADEVWDEPRAEHTAAGSFGQNVNTDAVVQGSGVTLAPGTHSVSINTVVNNADKSGYSLANTAVSSFISSLLSTNMGNSRFFQDMFHVIRNRVLIDGSVGTVYITDDATSLYTFSVTTTTSALRGVDPAGP